MPTKKRFYILFVSREADGALKKVPIPLHYAYVFVAAAAIGLFTITGLAGSYSRMLIKTARFNQLRHDHQTLQNDYAHLEKQAHEKDMQAASLGSLATEVSALYGLTANKLSGVSFRSKGKASKDSPVIANANTISNETYYKSLDAFYALRNSALSGDTTRILATPTDIGRMANPLMPGHDVAGLGPDSGSGPNLWPVDGEISSSFGEREDPMTGNGEGEFHPGIDIRAPEGTPIHATADGVVTNAGMVNGYGRFIAIDHGHGVTTGYGHMSGFAVTTGQAITRGQIIGYVGHSGRATGNHVHYEVRIHGAIVNPHKYLRTTLAQFATTSEPAS